MLYLKKEPTHNFLPSVTIDGDYVMRKIHEAILKNNGNTEITINSNFLLKPGDFIKLGDFDRDLNETINIAFGTGTINRLDVIEVIYNRI